MNVEKLQLYFSCTDFNRLCCFLFSGKHLKFKDFIMKHTEFLQQKLVFAFNLVVLHKGQTADILHLTSLFSPLALSHQRLGGPVLTIPVGISLLFKAIHHHTLQVGRVKETFAYIHDKNAFPDKCL